MSVLMNHIQRGLLAAIFLCNGAVISIAGEWANGHACGENCLPNAQSLGYVPTQWRRWPGTEAQVAAVPYGREAFPTPRYELPKPLHEAEGGRQPVGPAMIPPTGAGMEPSTGLLDSTHPMEGAKKPPRSSDDPSRPSGTPGTFDPFAIPPLSPEKKSDKGPSDKSGWRQSPLPALVRSENLQRVIPASAVSEEPALTADSELANEDESLRNKSAAGWRAVVTSSPTTRAGQASSDSSRAKPRPNPLREN